LTERLFDEAVSPALPAPQEPVHPQRTRRERRREERFEEELQYLLDERERSQAPASVVEHELEEQTDREPLDVEAATRA
jgi:hypothetical protein